MTPEHYKAASFLRAASEWLCDSYSIFFAYIALKSGDETQLSGASILLTPQPVVPNGMCFKIETEGIVVGQSQHVGQSKVQLLEILDRAAQGTIEMDGQSYSLFSEPTIDFSSEMAYRNRWFSDLHLQIIGAQPSSLINVDFAAIDNQLRRSDPPFDGLADVATWLSLAAPGSTHEKPSITIRIAPPVDLFFNLCKLHNDELTLVLHAHSQFDVNKVGLAVRAVPGNELAARKQVSSGIKWTPTEAGHQEGVAQISLERADSALSILMIGETTVRRQWFLDPEKARNERLIATQLFDKDLKMVRRAVLESDDSNRFEMGIAALLFLLGFSSAVQIETDSPDLIVTTPGRRVVLVECTLRIADFSSKLGKLVDRRHALSKAYETAAHYAEVYGILVCGQSRDQIAARANELEGSHLRLITRDELASVFDRLRFSLNPDELLDELFNLKGLSGSA